MLSYGESNINNIILVVQYEYDEYLKLWIWVEVPLYQQSKHECLQVSEIMSMIRFDSSFLILIGDLWFKRNFSMGSRILEYRQISRKATKNPRNFIENRHFDCLS